MKLRNSNCYSSSFILRYFSRYSSSFSLLMPYVTLSLLCQCHLPLFSHSLFLVHFKVHVEMVETIPFDTIFFHFSLFPFLCIRVYSSYGSPIHIANQNNKCCSLCYLNNGFVRYITGLYGSWY